MRGPRRQRLLLAGKTGLVICLGATAIVAIAGGRLGWANYWGGFVYAPIALTAAVLFGIYLVKNRGGRER